MISNSIAYEKAYQFSIRIVKAYKYIMTNHNEYVLAKQLLKSGTSIGANLAEANGGLSDADFSTKVSIAYKECLETKYWLSLLKDTNYIEEKAFDNIYQDAEEIARILYAILKSTNRISTKSTTDSS